MISAVQSLKSKAWRTERDGEFGSYAVTGWRYAEVPVWHVCISTRLFDQPGKSYAVAGAQFLPDTATEAERRAALHLIGNWETEGLDEPSA